MRSIRGSGVKRFNRKERKEAQRREEERITEFNRRGRREAQRTENNHEDPENPCPRSDFTTKTYFTTENTEHTEEQKRRGVEYSPEVLCSLFYSLCSPCSLW
jgi:hypothetical protein